MKSLSILAAATAGVLLLPSSKAPDATLGAQPDASSAMSPGDTKGGKRRDNIRPICRIAQVAPVPCEGDVTMVQLDASGSFDADGDPLTFTWASCPGSTFDDSTSATPILFIDTSNNCSRTCGVRLEISDGELTGYCRVFVEVVPRTGPHLDIKPGSCPNPINVTNYEATWAARVAVSLLGNDFDVTQANVSTLKLKRVDGGSSMAWGGNEISPVQNNMSDTGTPFLGDGPCGCHALGGDGVPDLDLKFMKIDIIEAFGLVQEETNTYIELELTGELMDGTPFSARDCIRVINNG